MTKKVVINETVYFLIGDEVTTLFVDNKEVVIADNMVNATILYWYHVFDRVVSIYKEDMGIETLTNHDYEVVRILLANKPEYRVYKAILHYMYH